jgi:hypothetical protein
MSGGSSVVRRLPLASMRPFRLKFGDAGVDTAHAVADDLIEKCVHFFLIVEVDGLESQGSYRTHLGILPEVYSVWRKNTVRWLSGPDERREAAEHRFEF